MIVKQIRLSQQSKDRLSRLKGKTGIKNWNVLCRWAFCYSLSEGTIPTDIQIPSDSNVEMSWYTFAGEESDIYDAVMKAWCIKMGLPTDDETLAKYFKLNLERGISHLKDSFQVEGCWTRISNLEKHSFIGQLLIEPYQNIGVHRNEMIEFIVEKNNKGDYLCCCYL